MFEANLYDSETIQLHVDHDQETTLGVYHANILPFINLNPESRQSFLYIYRIPGDENFLFDSRIPKISIVVCVHLSYKQLAGECEVNFRLG